VSKLIEVARDVYFVIKYAHECRLPISSMNTNYNRMQNIILNECFVVGLSKNLFMGTFKTVKHTIKVPLSPNTDVIEIRLDLEIE
jgi:hypothetical protein